jgi:hypothetical protein
LSGLPSVEEVNFWQPGGRSQFQALQPGELFLFKLRAPRIVGGGVFARSDILPVSLAWDAFGTGNGAASLAEMRERIACYRSTADEPSATPEPPSRNGWRERLSNAKPRRKLASFSMRWQTQTTRLKLLA